jgi:hypothetical protein
MKSGIGIGYGALENLIPKIPCSFVWARICLFCAHQIPAVFLAIFVGSVDAL